MADTKAIADLEGVAVEGLDSEVAQVEAPAPAARKVALAPTRAPDSGADEAARKEVRRRLRAMARDSWRRGGL